MSTNQTGGRRGGADYWWPALDMTSDALAVRHVDGRLLHPNQHFAAYLGREPAELVGRDISEFVPANHRAAHFERRKQLRERGAHRFTQLMQRADGSVLPSRVEVRQLEGGSVVGVMRELEGSRAVEAVARQERAGSRLWTGERHRASVDWSLEPVAIVNADLVVLYANEALSALLDQPRVALAGRAFNEFLVSEERTPWRTSMAHLATAGVFRRQARVLGRGGERIPVEVTGTVLGNHTFQLVVRDMSTWHEALGEALESRAG